MTPPLVDSTVVENIIIAQLLAVAGAQGIWVLEPGEAPPSPDPDQDGHTPHSRWCRLNNIILTPAEESRSETDDTAIDIATITITVGNAPSAMDPDQGGSPVRLNADVMIVASALHAKHLDHDATTHRVRCGRTTRRIEPMGLHESLRTGIVTLNATVYRKTGNTAVLTS